ncbi:hypothetical protein ERJ75_001061700 [Trypanosoma vivax]|nr:hypothetical protein ERJ75_001061700 [Trypanosoma vivax]
MECYSARRVRGRIDGELRVQQTGFRPLRSTPDTPVQVTSAARRRKGGKKAEASPIDCPRAFGSANRGRTAKALRPFGLGKRWAACAERLLKKRPAPRPLHRSALRFKLSSPEARRLTAELSRQPLYGRSPAASQLAVSCVRASLRSPLREPAALDASHRQNPNAHRAFLFATHPEFASPSRARSTPSLPTLHYSEAPPSISLHFFARHHPHDTLFLSSRRARSTLNRPARERGAILKWAGGSFVTGTRAK